MLRGSVIFNSGSNDAGKVIVSLNAWLKTTAMRNAHGQTTPLFTRTLVLFEGELSAGMHVWLFMFIFPTNADSDRSGLPGPETTPENLSVVANLLPPRMSVFHSTKLNFLGGQIEYAIGAQLIRPSPQPSCSNLLFLNYIPPRREESPNRNYVERSLSLTVSSIDLSPESQKRLLSENEIVKLTLQPPTVALGVILQIPTAIVPGTGPDIFACLFAVPEKSTIDCRPLVEMKDMRVVLRAVTRLRDRELTEDADDVIQEQSMISAVVSPTPISWGKPESIARIFNEATGSDGNSHPIVPTFRYDNIERTHSLAVDVTVECVYETCRLQVSSVPVHIFSPDPESEISSDRLSRLSRLSSHAEKFACVKTPTPQRPWRRHRLLTEKLTP